ncbi:MAG: FAS1-like dehydratase domain-containing protein [Janthinobacterium lividum]
MPITPDHAGRTYAPTAPYEVTRVKIVELATALGDRAAYDVSSPVAPPTFGAVVASPAWDALFGDPELGLQLSRIVHADQQFRYVRPLRPGDVVTATLRVDKVRVRGAVEIISTSVEVHDEAEAHVLTATSTFVHTRGAAA